MIVCAGPARHGHKFDKFKCISGRIEFHIQAEESIKSESIFFEMDQNVLPGNDAVAYTIAALCGTKYDEIILDLAITKKARSNIEKFTKAAVYSEAADERTLPAKAQKKDAVLLNFSGGVIL